MHVRWQNTISDSFRIYNSVRQGGILSPFLFRLYVYDLIKSISCIRVDCNVGGLIVNILCFSIVV
jgi:hypothetical protein